MDRCCTGFWRVTDVVNERRGVTGFWLGGPKVRDNWKDLGIGGRITLRWTLEREGSVGRTGYRWLRIRSSGGLF
jgi:hypothetical protein